MSSFNPKKGAIRITALRDKGIPYREREQNVEMRTSSKQHPAYLSTPFGTDQQALLNEFLTWNSLLGLQETVVVNILHARFFIHDILWDDRNRGSNSV